MPDAQVFVLSPCPPVPLSPCLPDPHQMHHACSPTCSHSSAGISRRDFLAMSALGAAAMAGAPFVFGQAAAPADPAAKTGKRGRANGGGPTHPLIDIHAHQSPDSMRGKGKKGGGGRTEAQFLEHQKVVNAIGSVILGGNDYEYEFIKADPGRYVRFASAGAGGADRAASVERALKNGAKGIGEHRWEGDIPFSWAILDMARDYKVPILFHFQESAFPKGVYSEFYKVIEKYPTVTFIGHAIDWWGAIDKNYGSKGGNYPRGRVTPGGLTDQWLSRYPNLHGDLSAGSGATAILRDTPHAKEFITRHQDKLMFGSDCTCTQGGMPTCWTAIKLVALDFLELSPEVEQKIYISNAAKMFGLKTT
jgi:predicted TIM-barrel fold metal-dependent hydrolase